MCGRCGFWFGIVVIFLVLVAPIIAIIVLDLGLDPFPRLRSINIRLVAVRGRWRHGREGAIAPHDIIIGSFVHGSGCEDMSGFLLRHVYRIVPEPRIEGEMGGSLCWKTIGIGVKFVGRESR